MVMRKFFLLRLLACFILLSPAAALTEEGGWAECSDIGDPYLREIAEWAVSEYNKNKTEENKLGAVVNLDSSYGQVVTGIIYKVNFLVRQHSGDTVLYETYVWDKPWKSRQLYLLRPLMEHKPLHYISGQGDQSSSIP